MVLINLFSRQQWRNRNREQTYGHRELEAKDEMYGESNMETYITIYKIESQWEFAVCPWELKLGLCINLEGWDGEGDGREVQKGGDMAQRLKRLPAMQETRVQSLGQEDPLERKWQPTPVFLPGESHGWRSLEGYSPWGL